MFRFLRSAYVRRWLRTNAIHKGLLGFQRPWLAVVAVGLLGRQVNKVLKRGPMPVLFSEKLEPGASFVITHLARPSRARPLKAKRS